MLHEDRDVVFEQFVESVRIGAVDDVAEPFLEQGVLGVQGLHILFEGEKSVPSRFFGQSDETEGQVLFAGRRVAHGAPDEPRDRRDVAHVEGDHGGRR